MPTTSSWWARAAPACGAALGAAGAGLKTACITKVFPRMQVELHEVEAEHRLFGDAPPHLLRRLSRLEIDRESEKEAGTGQLSRVDPAPQPPSPLEIAAGIAYGGDALRQPVPGLLGSHDCMLMEIDEARQGDAALRLEHPGSGRQPPAGRRPGTLDHTRANTNLCARDRRTGAACEQGGAAYDQQRVGGRVGRAPAAPRAEQDRDDGERALREAAHAVRLPYHHPEGTVRVRR
jgi:hypothetical protein